MSEPQLMLVIAESWHVHHAQPRGLLQRPPT